MKKIFVATLIMPQGNFYKFIVYKTGFGLWNFINENLQLTIFIFKDAEGYWSGSLSTNVGNKVQNNMLISQAIFELMNFYSR